VRRNGLTSVTSRTNYVDRSRTYQLSNSELHALTEVGTLLFDSRKFGTSRSLVIRPLPLTVCFQYVACGLCIAFPLMSGRDGGNAAHRDDKG